MKVLAIIVGLVTLVISLVLVALGCYMITPVLGMLIAGAELFMAALVLFGFLFREIVIDFMNNL